MPVQAEHLLTFLAVAQHGSLSDAAQQLYLTQPAISNQLKLLTLQVGEPIFRRHRYGVVLTAAGEALLPHAIAVKRALDGTQRHVEERRGLQTGDLRVAASLTIAATLLPAKLAEYHRRHPGIGLHIRQGNTQEVVQQLLEARCDLALIEGHLPPLPEDFQTEVFAQDRLALVVSPTHPLAHLKPVTKEALQGLGVVWRERGSGTREVAESALLQAQIKALDLLELAGTEAVKEAVIAGVGAAFLSERSIHREVAAGVLFAVQVDLPGLVRDFRAVGARGALLPHPARVLWQMLTAAIDGPSVSRS